MYRLFIAILIMSFSSLAMVDDLADAKLIDKKAEENCFSVRMKSCLNKCEMSQLKDCEQICHENAQNECKVAGD